jgi:16S rRNA (guanine527-N7)-methyltransferase
MVDIIHSKSAQEAKKIYSDLDILTLSSFELLITELLKWNKVHNLTGHDNYLEAYNDLILDGLCLAKYVSGTSLLDIGSGAGFPGIVLALALPHLKVALLEPRAKRVSFQKHVCRLLQISERVTSIAKRTDQIKEPSVFDTITLRAVTSLGDSLEMARAFKKNNSIVLLPRSLKDKQEAQQLGLDIVTYKPHFTMRQRILVIDKRPLSQCFT